MNLDRAVAVDPKDPAIRETRAKLARKRAESATASALPSHADFDPVPSAPQTPEAP
jgi:hypothetical protein